MKNGASMSEPINRRKFLKVLLGGGILAGSLGYLLKKSHYKFKGKLLSPHVALGHKLRDGANFPKPTKESEVRALIVGGGIAGLSAAWWFKRNGFDNFKILELEPEVGGNSRSGQNQYGKYPWGAHYIPLPGPEALYVTELFKDLKVIKGYNGEGLPIYDELFLCHEPSEKLFKDGCWQDGLVPQKGLQSKDKEEIERFFQFIKSFKEAKGFDRKWAFTVPLAFSSEDEKFRQLDKLSFKAWLTQNGFKTRPLLWYLNYCCRDDYGGTLDTVSAWAGIHYFAGRKGKAANANPQTVLTWPEGNGWIVNQLREQIHEHISVNSLAFKIQNQTEQGVEVCVYNHQTEEVELIRAKKLIYAAPRYTAKYILPGYNFPGIESLDYSPWLVANLSLSKLPEDQAWDNVSYYSPSLGYVVSNHQDIKVYSDGAKVITYYLPLSKGSSAHERHTAYLKQYGDWTKLIVDDLEQMLPSVSQNILNLDVWLWGHGMIKPTVGYLWGETRQQMLKNVGNIYFAHSDMSGISIFEEAQYQGVEAAKKVLGALS